MGAIVTFVADGKVYLLSGKQGVRGFETTGQALEYFEQSYHRKMAGGYEGSMSAG